MAKKMSFNVVAPIDEDDIFGCLIQLDSKELIKFIRKLDDQMCEIGFTEDLIKALAKSLKSDAEHTNINFIDWKKVK